MRHQTILMGLAGGIGGASSNLLDLARHLTASNPVPPGILWIVGTLIFFGLGAAVAMVFQETDSKKAFFLGIGLPALIAAAATTNAPISQQQLMPTAKPQSLLELPGLVVPVYAQTPSTAAKGNAAAHAAARPATDASKPAADTAKKQVDTPKKPADSPKSAAASPESSDGSTETLTLMPKGDVSSVGDYSVWFFDAAGAALGSSRVSSSQSPHKVDVPRLATKFGIWNDNVTKRVWDLPAKQNDLKIEITPQRHYANDFWYALGNRNLRSYEFALQPVDGP
jgi:hypothetical protein